MYNVGMLPVRGTQDIVPFKTVLEAQQIFRETLRIIDALRASPHGMHPELKFALDNARFHAGAIMSLLDAHLRTGGVQGDMASDVGNLQNSIGLFLGEIATATREWNRWSRDLQAQQLGADINSPPVPGTAAPTTVIEALPLTEQDLLEMSRPKTVERSMVFVGGALLLGGLVWLMRKA
jgi:hypothetical protein